MAKEKEYDWYYVSKDALTQLNKAYLILSAMKRGNEKASTLRQWASVSGFDFLAKEMLEEYYGVGEIDFEELKGKLAL